MSKMSTLSTTSQAFVDTYTLSDADAPWLSSLKNCAIDRFSKDGLPTVRDEKWKYTNLNYLEHSEWTEAIILSIVHSDDVRKPERL